MLRRLLGTVWALLFRGSGRYWERRYAQGRTSGSGSYGSSAAFKAGFLNDLLGRTGAQRVLELGCGDGAQLARIDYPDYVGIDISPTAVARCAASFAHDARKRFYAASAREHWAVGDRYDLSLSLDVIYHLVEDEVFEAYMADLFALSRQHVVIYSTNRDPGPGSEPAPHVRHRRFADWVERHAGDWALAHTERNPEAGLPDFYHYTRRGPATALDQPA